MLVAGAAGLGVVLAMLVIGIVLLTGRDDAGSPATGGAASRPPLAPTPAPSESSPVPADSEAGSEAGAVRCWDGSRASDLGRCGLPRGAEGMRWVFPRLGVSQQCEDAPAFEPRLRFVTCSDRLSDGTPVTMHYTNWVRVRPGIENYATANGLQSERLVGGRFQWLIYTPVDRTGSGRWKAAFMYEDAPFSVTIYTNSEAARTRAIAEVLQMRPGATLRGTR